MIFRILLGAYLAFHFAQLIPYAEELFGKDMPYDHRLSPVYGVLPNVLDYVNATHFLRFLTFAACLLMLETYPRVCAFVLWYGWAALFNRNILISNPGLAYIGWSLLALVLVEQDKTRTLFATDNFILKYAQRDKFPKRVFWSGWFLLAAGYTASGLHKLVTSPSWVNGTALQYVLESCLARDNLLRDAMLQFPTFLRWSTWFSLFLEISFLPLGVFYYTRLGYWFAFICFHLGILMLINFADLTIGVLMMHLFIFDWNWTTSFNQLMSKRWQQKRSQQEIDEKLD